jgi:hypothetical protein
LQSFEETNKIVTPQLDALNKIGTKTQDLKIQRPMLYLFHPQRNLKTRSFATAPAANAQSLPPLPNTQFLFRKFGTRGAKPNHGLFQESVTSALTGSFPSAPFGFFLLFFTRFEFNLIWVFFIFALESNFHAQLVMFNHYYAVLRSLLDLKICNLCL